MAARTGSAEQSNTSILYGRSMILKLFRRLEEGENPDVEIGRFLTETAHFKPIAKLLGDLTVTRADGGRTTVGMLQEFVESDGDGWSTTLAELDRFLADAATRGEPAEIGVATLTHPVAVDEALRSMAGGSLEAAAMLGQRTGEMHLALATETEDPAFREEAFTAADLTADAARLRVQIERAFGALERGLGQLDETTSHLAAVLLNRKVELLARAEAITHSAPDCCGQRIRIHGDYHLGQVLRAAGDYVLLDFEGEPARSLAERRGKQSPLRDVAGMLRSYSYAAAAGLRAYAGDATTAAGWARLWERAAAAEFLRGWQEAVNGHPDLLRDAAQGQKLLDAYLLEKAMYELLYELNNRPDWAAIPLSGIAVLAG